MLFVMGVITLTTDFGTRDWFVGCMKAVIELRAPGTTTIDITHAVSPGEVRHGALALLATAPFCRKDTIHVAVVDPGVGSARRPIALATDHGLFVGPDNGVLSWAAKSEMVREARVIANDAWFVKPLSRTFHGRDVFAPVAAMLSKNPAAFEEVGEPVSDFVRLDWPEAVKRGNECRGEVIHVDRFGNAITNIPGDWLERGAVLVKASDAVVAVRGCYAEAPYGEALAIIGSVGFLELAVNGGAFATTHAVSIGSAVEVSCAGVSA